jgi:hypothetical protein
MHRVLKTPWFYTLRLEQWFGCRQQLLRWQGKPSILAAQPESEFRHPIDKQSYCPAALGAKKNGVKTGPGQARI